jgi:hypothetical protein
VISEGITLIRKALYIAAVALACLFVVITFAGTRSTDVMAKESEI